MSGYYIMDTCFAPQGCPLMRASTVVKTSEKNIETVRLYKKVLKYMCSTSFNLLNINNQREKNVKKDQA